MDYGIMFCPKIPIHKGRGKGGGRGELPPDKKIGLYLIQYIGRPDGGNEVGNT